MVSFAGIKYDDIERVVLFGGTPLMGALFRLLTATGTTVWPYTAPRQAATCDLEPPALNICEDINESFPLDVADRALGIGLGEAWTFGPEIREAFGDRLVDFMSIPYPRYLGGAHITHAQLRGETKWGCCMQLVTENTVPGVVHDGDVIATRTLNLPEIPDKLDADYLEFIRAFVADAKAGKTFIAQKITQRTRFFPRLNTVKQAWIDWSWHRLSILRFIQAFDDPYPGARSLINGRTVILRVADDLGVEPSHPFHNGLIVNCHDGRIEISTLQGVISAIPFDEDDAVCFWITPGMRLFTPRQLLDDAMVYTPNYTPTGDANA